MSSGLRSLSKHEYVSRSPSGGDKYENRKSTKSTSNASDSEGSVESNSLSQGSTPEPLTVNPPIVTQGLNGGKKGVRRNSEWEILEGLKGGQRYDRRPQAFSGVLHKKRKWPLKGWHKRFFYLEKGILVYGKSQADVSKGKVHGSVDIGLSVISTKARGKRLDIDTEEFIYHLKAKQTEIFTEWVEQLRRHRLFRQHVLTFGTKDSSGLFHHIRSETPQPKISPTKLMIESIQVDLNNADEAMMQLSSLLERIDSGIGSESVDGLSPNVKKDRRKFVLRKKKNSKGSSVDLIPNNSSSPGKGQDTASLTVSQSMSGMPESGLLSAPSISSAVSDTHLASEFHLIAKDVYHNLKSIVERIKVAVAETSSITGGTSIVSVRQALHTALQQNSELYEQNAELRTRLESIREKADITHLNLSPQLALNKTVGNNLSYSSSCVSEFFYDAKEGPVEEEEEDEEDKRSDTSSVAGSVSSEASVSSEGSTQDFSQLREATSTLDTTPVLTTGRRDKLPAVRPNTEGLSLWSLLTKNIGKDLSQVSMPVGLNEPLNMLQRLCEELEYSELLDKASELSDPYDRLVYVAAFAVSAYGSSYYRAGSKPFNPLLGETYECIREDRGFKFISEQVSHHPPVSASYCESKNYIFSQDMRIKTKFWGKSMEFQPTGYATLILERPDKSGVDKFRWNKVTTCVHNLFSTQRWVDQYGELTITTDYGVSCKLTFVKASYWSAKRHEIYGSIVDHNEGGVEVRKLFGKWSEALYCSFAHSPTAKLIWRPGAMPEDYELYYGFTRFAMELNELDAETAKHIPCTDTRFRPDQRLLEEGDLDGAEKTKKKLEQAQRERRKQQEEAGISHQPKWFRKEIENSSGEECWVFTHKYWEARNSKAYDNITPLW